MGEPGPTGTKTSSDRAGTLRLFSIPFALHQKTPINLNDFIVSALDWGIVTNTNELQQLHQDGILSPAFAIDTRQFPAGFREGPNSVLGRLSRNFNSDTLLDPAQSDHADFCFSQFDDAPSDFYYLPWQLLDLPEAQRVSTWKRLDGQSEAMREEGDRLRNRTVALAALSGRHLPSVVGRIRADGDADLSDVIGAQYDAGTAQRLAVIDYRAVDLQPTANRLLSRAARDDPMREWWPVIRHAGELGWNKLHGGAALAVWQRVAAEILLRGHEHLADDKALPPLDTGPTEQRVRHPQDDRIFPRETRKESVSVALGRLGLSPAPRVAVIVEGETEEYLLRKVLDHLQVSERHVRIFPARTSAVRLNLVAQAMATPRVGAISGDRFFMDGPPTALFIAMDPENHFSPEKFADEAANIRDAVLKQSRANGVELTAPELDLLETCGHGAAEHSSWRTFRTLNSPAPFTTWQLPPETGRGKQRGRLMRSPATCNTHVNFREISRSHYGGCDCPNVS